MQKHFSVFMKLMVTVLLFGVASFAKAATVTYSLTTKVDGRTITATANLNAADLTQEITEAPASGGTVYVDYEFDPPFILSEEGQDPVYHYLRTYNYSGSNNYLVIYDQSAENEWGTYKETILTWRSVSGATSGLSTATATISKSG